MITPKSPIPMRRHFASKNTSFDPLREEIKDKKPELEPNEIEIDATDVKKIEGVDEIPEGAEVVDGVVLTGTDKQVEELLEGIETVEDTSDVKEPEVPTAEVEDPVAVKVSVDPVAEAIAMEQARKAAVAAVPVEEGPKVHYFYCKKADGEEVTYRKKTTTKTYEAEVPILRKKLEAEGTVILKEEIK